MALRFDPPFTPRGGVTLNVLAVCRISTVHQDPRSLADQEALLRRYIAERYDGPTRWEVITSQGSGEHLDRRELDQIEERLETQTIDVLIAEDLGRICRRTRAYDFCELAEDCGTRVLALNDAVDTGRDGWQMTAFFSVVRHEMYNKDTAARIRRSQRNRFLQGGVVQFATYGIIKPPGVKSDADLKKDPAAEPILDTWFRMLEQGASYSEVADWLNEKGIPPGPYARSGRWTCALVREMTFNPILKGVRVRNRKVSKRVNRTGRHRSVAAQPEELLVRPVPHLMFIEPERYDRVIAMLKARNAMYRRRGTDGRDARKGIPRKRTRWPGQHLTCGVCGRIYYFGGHGRKDYLMCSGNREYKCWNGITVAAALAAERIGAAILTWIENLEGFDQIFEADLRAEIDQLRSAQADSFADLARREAKVDRALANIRSALREAGGSRTLIEELKTLEAEKDRIALERHEMGRLPHQTLAIPSWDRVKEMARRTFNDLSGDSQEFGRLMRTLMPRLEVHPYGCCDGAGLILRAHLTLDLAPLVPGAEGLRGLSRLLRYDLVVDLSDPPQRVAYRERILALKAKGQTEAEIARALGLTKTAVQRAAALDREMQRRGLSDPYELLTGPPDGQERMRRHRHPRYRFEPKSNNRDSPDAAADDPEAA